MKITWETHLKNLRAEPKYKPILPINTLDHCLPIISAVKLIKNPDTGLIDSGLMIKPIRDNPEGIIKHPNGNITNKEYLNMLVFLGEINRSKIVSSMKKDSRLGSLTPLGLYAYKLNYDISYEAWDKTSSFFGMYLGKFLMPLLSTTKYPTLTTEDIIEYRDIMQTVRTTGVRKTNSDYRGAIKTIKEYSIPAPAAYMLLQLWIANVEFRNTDSMILNPMNWDNIPEALDAIVKQPVVGKREAKSKLDPDAWWKT